MARKKKKKDDEVIEKPILETPFKEPIIEQSIEAPVEEIIEAPVEEIIEAPVEEIIEAPVEEITTEPIFVIAEGCAITSTRGILSSGDEVKNGDIPKKSFDKFIEIGHIVKKGD